jgi:hypothetical protein
LLIYSFYQASLSWRYDLVQKKVLSTCPITSACGKNKSARPPTLDLVAGSEKKEEIKRKRERERERERGRERERQCHWWLANSEKPSRKRGENNNTGHCAKKQKKRVTRERNLAMSLIIF